MTPRQRRLYKSAIEKAAQAPRKSWLGRFTPLNSIQSAWVSSLLTVWGESVRGGTAPAKPCGHSCWNIIRGKAWSDKALERFTAALNQAREEGFRGEQAMRRARSILWPEPPAGLIDEAMTNDDVEFVENAVLNAFELADPVYVVGCKYYTTRKKISDISKELRAIAPWLTERESRERVNWCLQIFRAKVYLSIKKQTK